MEQKKIK